MKKIHKLRGIAVMLLVAAQALTNILPASAALAEVGPVNPTTGFPEWYRDTTGLTLDLMEAADPMSVSAPVDPANPFSQTIGFNAEGFWWSADSTVTGPTGADGLLVLALEAAFAGEAAVNGEQSSFGRVRIRVDVPEPGTYTVTHPYGQQIYDVTAVGPGLEINDTSDIGCFGIPGVFSCAQATPPNFSTALVSGIGPFLTWDTFNPNPALTDPALINPLPAYAGRSYVGNPLIAHSITGSPNGTNFFRIEGPNIGGAGVNVIENNLFTVSGRLAVIAAPLSVTVNPQTATVATPTITGTVSDPAATVSVVVDTQPTVNATVNPDGTWTATVATALANGTFEVVATATSGANTATDTTANELIVNVGGGPVAPTVTVNAQTATTGTPTITGTVSDPAATVSVVVGTQPAVNATVNPDGTWTATVATALANGTYEVVATATNAAGTGTDTTTNELTINIPAALTVTVNPQTATVATPAITGTVSDPAATVSVVVDTQPAVNATVNPDGTWTATVATALANGTFEVVATATSGANTATDTTANELTVNVTAPAVLAISNVAVSNITDNSATVTWTTNVPSTGNVQFDRSNTLRRPTTVNDPTLATTHSVTLNNLGSSRTIFFKVTANADTRTAESAVAQFQTLRRGTTPPPANVFSISGVQVTNITVDSATISWTTSVPTTGTVTVANGRTLRNPLATVSDPVSGTTHSVNITGLTAGRNLFFKVAATDGTNTVESPIDSFQTLRRGNTPPPTDAFTISNIQTTNITNNSFTVTWTTSLPTTGSVVVDSNRSFGSQITTVNDPVSGTTHTATITGLTPNRSIYFKVTATNGTNTVESGPERVRTTR